MIPPKVNTLAPTPHPGCMGNRGASALDLPQHLAAQHEQQERTQLMSAERAGVQVVQL